MIEYLQNFMYIITQWLFYTKFNDMSSFYAIFLLFFYYFYHLNSKKHTIQHNKFTDKFFGCCLFTVFY